jgi:hypothetical protein
MDDFPPSNPGGHSTVRMSLMLNSGGEKAYPPWQHARLPRFSCDW